MHRPNKSTFKKIRLLTPLQKFQDIFLSSERGVVALIVQADQDIQQRFHTQALAIRLSWPVQDQLLQLLQTHLSRHDYSGLLGCELMMMEEVGREMSKHLLGLLVSAKGPVKKFSHLESLL